MIPKVKVGKFGEIKKLMRQLSKREAFVDLEFVCIDGSLFCHKFIIGAQSRFLRQIMLKLDEDQMCRILLPDIPKQHMEIVLKFLYTGRLGITASVKNIVRELLEDILRIDARINLPEDALQPPAAVERSNRRDDGNGDGGGKGRPQNGRPEHDAESREKRARVDESSSNYNGSNSSQVNGADWASSAKSSSYRYPDHLPLSPPHFLEADDDEVVFIEARSIKKPPIFVELSDSEDEMKIKTEEVQGDHDRHPQTENRSNQMEEDQVQTDSISRIESVTQNLLNCDWPPKPTTGKKSHPLDSGSSDPCPLQHSALPNNKSEEQLGCPQTIQETVEESCPTIASARIGPFNPFELLQSEMSHNNSLAEGHLEQPVFNVDSASVSDTSASSRNRVIVPAPVIISKKTCQFPARLDFSKPSKVEASPETESSSLETVEENCPAIASVRFGPFNPFEILQATTLNKTSLCEEHEEQPIPSEGRSDFFSNEPIVQAPTIIAKKTWQIPASLDSFLFHGEADANQDMEQDNTFIEDTQHEDLSVASQIDYRAGSIVPAPSVIAKRTCPPPRTPKIFKAPKVMAKSTGGFFAKGKRGRPSKDQHLPPKPDSVSSFATYPEPEVFPMPNGQVTFTYHSKNTEHESSGNAVTSEDANPGLGRVTRSRSGSLEKTNLYENALIDQFGGKWLLSFDNLNHANDNQIDSNSFEVPLPPPVPEPPRDGMVICRGKWTSAGKRSKRGSGRQQAIRRHHYSPHTITGVVKETTLATLAEPDGEHQCTQCPARYNKLASLDMHIRRNHNPNLQVKCPECPKMLSCRAAIRKHLLSHRPETEWPFHCVFCFKRFQARGDLPKHFHTYRHRNDPRIPEVGTDAWRQLLEQCSVIQPGTMLPTSKRKRPRQKTTTHVGIPDSPPDLPIENGDPNATSTNLCQDVTDEIECSADPDAQSVVVEPESIVSDLDVNTDLMTSSSGHINPLIDTIYEPESIVLESRNSSNPNSFSIQNILATDLPPNNVTSSHETAEQSSSTPPILPIFIKCENETIGYQDEDPQSDQSQSCPLSTL